jgi:hypothetical protein
VIALLSALQSLVQGALLVVTTLVLLLVVVGHLPRPRPRGEVLPEPEHAGRYDWLERAP